MIVSKTFTFEKIWALKTGVRFWGKPKLFSHIYFIDGLLIDSGQARARKSIFQNCLSLKVKQLFITHHHEDHSGNIAPMVQQFNCKTYASQACVNIMKKPPPLSFVQKLSWGNRPAYTNLIPLEKELKTEHYTFQLIPIPGHAPDMVALYEADQKWLFSADLFIHPYIGYFLENESILQQIKSIKKILRLDFKVMLCSHNPQFEKPKEALTQKLHFLENFYGQVIQHYEKGINENQIFKLLQLKENHFVKLLSNGKLSKINMLKSAIRDYEQNKIT